MIIYKAINKINGMIYIGQTIKKLKYRISEHISKSRYSKTYFHNALKKYGINNFKWKILLKCISQEELIEMEKYFIEKYKKENKIYNLTNGGEGVKGYKHTDQTKKIISGISKKMWENDDFKKERSLMYKGNAFFKGKKHSNETKQKYSLVRKGKPHPQCYSRKDIDDKSIYEYLKKGFSYRKIAKIFNTCHETIRFRILKKQKAK